MGRSAFLLGLLTIAVGYAVITHGGDAPADSSQALLLIGFTAVIGSLTVFKADLFSSRERIIDIAAFAFPAYVAFQLVPLPVALLRVVAPVRAEVANALAGVMAAPHFAPLTIAPATTWVYLVRIAGYTLIFLLVRQIARRSIPSAWASVIPLLVIGALEAAWALTLPQMDGTPFSGTYYSRDHFAGLLEMILPFALAYGVALLYPRSRRDGFTPTPAIGAIVLFVVAAALFIAIMLSASKLGVLSSLGSLFVMGILGLQWRRPGWRRWPAVAGFVALGLIAIVFLTPTQFVEQFGANLLDRSTEGRLPIAKDTLRLFAAYPLFGCGLGSFYPGLLRYQISGLGVAWVNAHNDYVQLLAELGSVGFLIPAVLMCTVFARSVRAALSSDNRERRLMGLACAGGLAAILIHSVGDYNTYVLANAMVLAWITGIAASLPSGNAQSDVPKAPPGVGRAFVLALGCAVALYAGGWLVFLNAYHGDRSAERFFCRFGICDTDAAMAALRVEREKRADEALLASQLLEYLMRDPAAPTRWDDVGEALQKAGRTASARYSFARAVALGPTSPSTLLMAADFHFDVGEKQTALELISRSLQTGSDDIAKAVFADLEFRGIPVDETMRLMSLDRGSSQVYLRLLTSGDNADAEKAAIVWRWMVGRGFADDPLARDLTESLMGKRPELAWQSWVVYAAERNKGYPETNRIFNGDFESDPTGCRFDWKIQPASGTTIDFDRGVRRSGGRSLRVQFDGTENPSDVGVQQMVFLKPGRYRLRGYVRTKELSTDEGISLRVVKEGGPAPIGAVTGPLRGTNDWTLVERVFDAPPSGGFVWVSLARKASLKFDNLLRGTVWIDQVSISEARN